MGQYVTLNGDVVSHINISSVLVEDGGEYTCEATNSVGSLFHSARLNIYGKSEVIFTSVSDEHQFRKWINKTLPF